MTNRRSKKPGTKARNPPARDELPGFKTNLREVADCTASRFRPYGKADIKRLQLILGETPLVTLLWGYYMKSALRRILTEFARRDVPTGSPVSAGLEVLS
jgi:hypothetical protein